MKIFQNSSYLNHYCLLAMTHSSSWIFPRVLVVHPNIWACPLCWLHPQCHSWLLTSSAYYIKIHHLVLQQESTISIYAHRCTTWVEYFLECFKNLSRALLRVIQKLESSTFSSASRTWVKYFFEYYSNMSLGTTTSTRTYIDSGDTPTTSVDGVPEKNANIGQTRTRQLQLLH
jgi:hypothetical protein